MTKKEFKSIVFNYSVKLFPMAMRMLGNKMAAEDALQDIMVKLWEKRFKLKNHPNIKGLIVLTARNHCIDVIRKEKKMIHQDSNSFYNLEAVINTNDLEWLELNKHIKRILTSLPQQQQEVFVMRDIDGYEFKEIAYTLDITIENARVLLSRARNKISKELNQTYQYEKGRY